jgi:hypothetical protein
MGKPGEDENVGSEVVKLGGAAAGDGQTVGFAA